MGSFSGLLNNAALMLVFCVIYDIFIIHVISNKNLKSIITGVLVGLISIAVMLNPWSLQPGVFFDTRWVLLSLSGLFFGLVPTVVAVIIAGLFRLYQGGAGQIVGTLVIVVTACVGLAWRYWKEKHGKPLDWKQLYIFGVLVQLAMFSCTLLMPADMIIPMLKAVALPILIIFPVLTMLIGLILKGQEDRRGSENELLQSKAEFEAIFNSITDSVVFANTERRAIRVNPAFIETFGYTSKEMQGKTTEFIYADYEAFKKQGKERYNVEAEIKESTYEIEYRRKDGTVFPAETLGTHVLSPSGEILGFLGVIRDISDRKQAEEEKEKLEKQLQQAYKMEAVGTLAGGIAHDFNNILSIILGYSEMAKEDAPPDSLYIKDLDQILDAGNRAKDLVKQILSFSSQSQVEKIVLKPQPLINEALKMLRSSIPTTIEIQQNILPDCGTIEADPTQFHQILINLCTNAFHAMEKDGGILGVDLRIADTLPLELQEQKTAADLVFIELSISDTGQGIGPDVINHIFDPFFTTKEQGEGTGMGLAITYGIVKDYGGAITVDSKLGEGTTFHVYLPQSKGDIKQQAIEEATDLEGKERILFVDDEEILANMGKEMLERLGYHVTVKHRSLEALDAFQNQPEFFDLVITDQTMPGMTGLDLARRMMQIRPDIPIILCTGYSLLVNEEVAKAQGIKSFALKPLTKNSTAKLIRQILDESKSTGE